MWIYMYNIVHDVHVGCRWYHPSMSARALFLTGVTSAFVDLLSLGGSGGVLSCLVCIM